MTGYCEIEINGKKTGVLFGVALFAVLESEALELTDSETDIMNGIHIVYAAIKNNANLERLKCDISVKDVYLFANNETEQYADVLKCFEQSKTMGKTVAELSEQVKNVNAPEKKKRTLFGRLFQKLV